MKPVTSTLASQNSARNSVSSADAGNGERFASLFSSLSAASSASPAAKATRAPQKPTQGNASQNAGHQSQSVKDAAREQSADQTEESSANTGTTTSTSAAAPSEAQGKDAVSQAEKDEAAPDAVSEAVPNATDAAAQLLALTQQAQGITQNAQAASATKGEPTGEAPGDKRSHGARGVTKAEILAVGRADDKSGDAGTAQAAPESDFIGHIADAQALQHGKAGATHEDALASLQTRQENSNLQPAAPAATNAFTVRGAETLNAAKAASEHLAPRVGAAGWDRALGQKVVWMVGQGEQSASLTLNPPDLGPVQVVLTISQSQASADFSSAQPEVRQALQDALPRLREMLADAGISLGQANVHAGTGEHAQQTHQGGGHNAGGSRGASGSGNNQSAGTENSRPAVPVRQGSGLVNTYV